MKSKIELLAPGGDIDSIKAAIFAGADAIYCGLDRFNARNSAANIRFDDLRGVLRLAHENNCRVFLTLNIIILEHEIPAIIDLLNKLVNTGIDGIIVQDLGLLYILSTYFKSLKIHASTQLTTHNEGQLNFLSKLSVGRVNLSRELNINEIKALTPVASKNNIQTEVFVHGSYCISFSGICYISSVQGGNSGNRGRCSQACRDRFLTTPAGKNYPLNLKDNSAFFDLKELARAGVYSLKIEGRIKKFDYIYTVVNTWRNQIQRFYSKQKPGNDNSDLYKVFNRDFSNSFLKGDINKEMFIDNPRDNSIKRLSGIKNYSTKEELEQAHLKLYKEKDEIKRSVEDKIRQINTEKLPLTISISGERGNSLKVTVKTPGTSFDIFSGVNLAAKGTEALNQKMVLKRLKALNDTGFYIKHIDLDGIKGDVFIPFKELTSIKNRILFILNDSREIIKPVDIPKIKKPKKTGIKPSLSVLISSKEDLYLCNETRADIYFQLANSIKNDCSGFIDLFIKNKKLIPWFPPILIGEDYNAAVDFLKQLRPKIIVSNNTGIAYEANKLGISWIAGPYLNIVNSYSLLCLKEKLNCSGAFISNEINKIQVKQINSPGDFKLYYSIYHPIVLMTSRQCLFHQVTGCEKSRIDGSCIGHCEKSLSITGLKKNTLYIEKSRGNYHNIYNETNFLNTGIVADLQGVFSGFFVDLRNIKTETTLNVDKSKIIKLFEKLLNGKPGSEKKIRQAIYPTTVAQYKKGI